jgi:hypothetical protein
MNCMWLDDDLNAAAEAHATAYTKLILEAGQCLCSALHNNGLGEASPYGAGYNHHAISRWASQSAANWFHLRDYMDALTQHYYSVSYDELRSMELAVEYWENNDVHKTPCSIADAGVEPLVRQQFPDTEQNEPPICVLDFCDTGDLVESYRKYIVCYKSHLDWWEWSSGAPSWYDDIRRRFPKDYRRGQAYAAARDLWGEEETQDLIPKPQS